MQSGEAAAGSQVKYVWSNSQQPLNVIKHYLTDGVLYIYSFTFNVELNIMLLLFGVECEELVDVPVKTDPVVLLLSPHPAFVENAGVASHPRWPENRQEKHADEQSGWRQGAYEHAPVVEGVLPEVYLCSKIVLCLVIFIDGTLQEGQTDVYPLQDGHTFEGEFD